MDARARTQIERSSIGEERLAGVRRRRIQPKDFDALCALLTHGFPERKRSYWETALRRMADLAGDAQEFGYLLEAQGRPVGVVLAIRSVRREDGEDVVRKNLSSWYAEPAYRGYAPLLIASTLQDKNAIHINVSPAPHTRPVIEAQGFVRYSRGQFYAVAGGARPRFGSRLRRIRSAHDAPEGLDAADRRLLLDHAAFGCISLACEGPRGVEPYVFLPRRVARERLPAAQLVYCRGLDAFLSDAWTLGAYLLRRGFVCLVIDSDGPLPGLLGKFYPDKNPLYFRGPRPPRLGDLAYTESPMFGP